MSLVSVILPCYNHEKFVAEALNSVTEQDYRPIEIVIVDDGSTDRTLDQIRGFVKLHAHSQGITWKIIKQKNSGTSVALNNGISASSGKICAILNSDDRFDSKRLSLLVPLVKSKKTLFAASLVEYIGPNGKALKKNHVRSLWYFNSLRVYKNLPSFSYSCLTFQIFVSSSNFVFSKSLWRRLGGFRNFTWCHDHDFILRASLFTSPILVEKSLLHYRYHHDNSMLAANDKRFQFCHERHRLIEDFIETAYRRHQLGLPIHRLAPTPHNYPRTFFKYLKTLPSSLLPELPYSKMLSFLNSSVVSFSRTTCFFKPDVLERLSGSSEKDLIESLAVYSPFLYRAEVPPKQGNIGNKIKRVQILDFLDSKLSRCGTVVRLTLNHNQRDSEANLNLITAHLNGRIIAILRCLGYKSKSEINFAGFTPFLLTPSQAKQIYFRDLIWSDF